MNSFAPGEATQIMTGVKRLLRSRGMTYAELAGLIDLSEPSVKRIFASASLSLARLLQICQVLDVPIQEVVRLAGDQTSDGAELLSLEQESALAADPSLFACFNLILNGRTGREIAAELGVDERNVRRWFVRLNALGLVEVRTKLRAKALTASTIVWRRDGPVRRLYEQQVRREYLQSSFSAANEALYFRSAELSDASCRVLLRKLERLSAEFRDLAELDRTLPSREKRSIAVLLAARPWVFSMFESLRRVPAT